MSHALIEDYIGGLRRRLPADLAEEAAAGLTDTYERHLAGGGGQDAAARDAVAEFGDQELVVGEFVRQAPGRGLARLLLATGPIVGGSWALALISSRAWDWPVPPGAKIAAGATLVLLVTALAVAATSRTGYRRTRLAAAVAPVLAAADITAITAVALAGPIIGLPLGLAVTASAIRAVATLRAIPRLTAR